jgi:hypothetical protein
MVTLLTYTFGNISIPKPPLCQPEDIYIITPSNPMWLSRYDNYQDLDPRALVSSILDLYLASHAV